MKRVLLLVGMLTAGFAVGAGDWLRDARADHFACHPSPYLGFRFDTYEPEDYVAYYGEAIHIAAEGAAGLAPYAVGGDTVNLQYQGLERGPRGARVGELDRGARIPPTIFKSIIWIESNWANGSATVPYGGAGPSLVSLDCGYGLAQVTSGMANTTGTASAKQAAIGTHPLFNLAEGARILADKWNAAPGFRPVAGTGDPAAIEDWYYAVWSYNGFAFSNHPLNPNRDPLRGAEGDLLYHCENAALPSFQAGYVYGDYTYPERVYGCMRYPPARDGQALWQPIAFNMPALSNSVVAEAFNPQHFLDCELADFEGGCPAMDFPTTFADDPATETDETRFPLADPTPPFDPLWLGKWLGDPLFTYSGPTTLALTASDDGSATSGTVTVHNAGTWIAPFRIRVSQPWIVVKHPTDTFPRSLDGSVAVGAETEVVLQRAKAGQPRIAQQGWDSVLRITLDTANMPDGLTVGSVTLEPLLGSGGTFTVEIIAAKGASGLPYKAVVPVVSQEK